VRAASAVVSGFAAETALGQLADLPLRDRNILGLVRGALRAAAAALLRRCLLGGDRRCLLGGDRNILGLVLGTLRATALLRGARGGFRDRLVVITLERKDQVDNLLLEVIRGTVRGDNVLGKFIHQEGSLCGKVLNDGGHDAVVDSLGRKVLDC